MKKFRVGFICVLAVLSLGLLLIACGSSDEKCKTNADCGTGYKCNLVTGKCIEDACPNQCGTKVCGPTPATCDDASATCGTCSGATPNCNTTSGMCEACANQCNARQCGPTPATCDAPSVTCGTCSGTQTCNASGMCVTANDHPGSGDACKCENAQSCSIPCPTAAGSANMCILTNETTGDGFCSFGCSAAGADSECTAAGDFPNGCCKDLGGEAFCLKADYCGSGPGNREYLETCGTQDTGACKAGLVCVGFSSTEEWGYCVHECSCPNPNEDGECPNVTCLDQGLCVQLEDGSGGCIPPGDQPLEGFCHVPDNGCAADLICINYGTLATSGNGMCTPLCNNTTGAPCVDPMECILPLQSDYWACSRPCPSHNKSECPNNGTGWQCYNLGDATTPDWQCIPE